MRKIFHQIIMFLFLKAHRYKLDWINGIIFVIATAVSTLYWKIKFNVSLRKKSNCNILAFNRDTFWKDLAEIDKRTDINVIYLPYIYSLFSRVFLHPQSRSQVMYHVHDNNSDFLTDYVKKHAQGFKYDVSMDTLYKKDLRDAVSKVLPYLVRTFKIDVLLSANVQYYQDQEWMSVCKENNIPFLVLCKEGIVTKFVKQLQIDIFRDIKFKYPGYKVAVYSQGVKDILTLGGVTSVKNIVVTGMPRTDLVYDSYLKRKSKGNRSEINWIVMFDFYKWRKDNLWQDSVDAFVQLAANPEFKNYKFIIKTQGQNSTRSVVSYCHNKYSSLGRLVVSDKVSFFDITKYSELLCGFYSTSLVKFMFTDIPILIVNWAEARESTKDRMFNNPETGAFYMADSKEEFLRVIEDYIKGKKVIYEPNHPVAREARNGYIKDHLYKIDGCRSFEVSDFIKKSIFDFKKQEKVLCKTG